ncbi:MAG: LuxR C-terminal-related transcriptional regulator, partial [Candidatus Bipolaricaulia bacterium]
PRLDGLEAIVEVHRASPKTRVLLLSMFDNVEYILKAAQAGASGYLLKESLAEELGEAIQTIRKQSRFYLSRAMANRWLRKCFEEGRLPARPLTSREQQVLGLIGGGLTTRELGISVKTVETHRERLMEKLDIHTTAGLVRYALTKGLAEPGKL